MNKSLRFIGTTASNVFDGIIGDIKGIRFDHAVCLIIAVQALVFIYPIFIMNDLNISVLTSISTDHGSILDSMMIILKKHTFYNQMAGFHSSFYGWTYFFISFIFLAPINFVLSLFHHDTFTAIYIGQKILNFIYGLLASVSFYYLCKKFTGQFFSAAFTFILMLASSLTFFNYTFHPEPIGVFFLNVACIVLYNFAYSKELKRNALIDYLIVLLCLVLTTLTKPTFFTITAPLYLVLLNVYAQNTGYSLFAFLKTKKFAKLLVSTFILSLLIFFIINPYFFLWLNKALDAQFANINAQSNSSLVLHGRDILIQWIDLFFFCRTTAFIISATLINTLYLVVQVCRKKQSFNIILFLQISVLLNIALVIYSFRLSVSMHYIIPILPFLLINGAVLTEIMIRHCVGNIYMKRSAVVVLLLFMVFPDVDGNLFIMKQYYDYKNHDTYKIFSFIRDNVPRGSTILHDHFVAIPSNMDIKDFHFWQHSREEMSKCNPDYIIFDPTFRINAITPSDTQLLTDMVKDGHYKNIKSFTFVQIWQKPEAEKP